MGSKGLYVGRFKLSKKRLIQLIVITTLAVAIYLIVHHLNAPVRGQVQYLNPTESSNAVTTSVKVINSKYFSLTSQGRYINTPNNNPSPGSLEYWLLQTPVSTGIGGSNTIGITIKKLTGSFTEESSYQRYFLNKKDYRIAPLQLGNNTFTHIIKISGGPYEEAAYLENGKTLAVIVASSSGPPSPTLTKEFHDLLTSYKWTI